MPLQKKEWPRILFLWVPHPLINENFICQQASYLCILAPLHSVIEREEHEKLFSCHYMEIWKIHAHDSIHSFDWCATMTRQKGDYTLFSVLSNILQNVKRIVWYLKHFCKSLQLLSSMQPWSGATANRHQCGSGERNGEQRRAKVNFGRTMMRALELLRLVKSTSWDEAT